MWWLIPAIAAAGAGLAGFIFGEKRKEEEIEAKLKEEYYKCIQTLVKEGKLKPKDAYRYCSYTSDDISVAKVFILSASLISMGLALYALGGVKQPKIETKKEVKYVGAS